MSDCDFLARLRIMPCGLFEPVWHAITLVKSADGYRLDIMERNEVTNEDRRWRVDASEDDVAKHLSALRQATVPAFPISPMVCDGEYVELTVNGEFSTLTLGWWTIAPCGAQAFADFALWIRETALGASEWD